MFIKDNMQINLSLTSGTNLFDTRRLDTLVLGFSVTMDNKIQDLSKHDIKFYATLPNGTRLRYKINIEKTGKRFYITLPPQFTSELGKVEFEFEFTNEQGTTTSPTYSYSVKDRVKNQESVDIGTLEELKTLNDLADETVGKLIELNNEILNTIQQGGILSGELINHLDLSNTKISEIVQLLESTNKPLNDLREVISQTLEVKTNLEHEKTLAINVTTNLSDTRLLAEEQGLTLSSIISESVSCKNSLVELGNDLSKLKVQMETLITNASSENLKLIGSIHDAENVVLLLNSTINDSNSALKTLTGKISDSAKALDSLNLCIERSLTSENQLSETINLAISTESGLSSLYQEVIAWSKDFDPHLKIPELINDVSLLKENSGKVKIY